jgi:hypothetical protein
MSSVAAPKDLSSSLSKLSISTSPPTKKKKNVKKTEVADSWEDEELSSSDSEDTETEAETALSSRGRKAVDDTDEPSAPPPTPASPSGNYPADLPYNPYQSIQPSRERQSTPEKRPEKTTSVAARLIAGSLGVRAPKRTEEQREFDKAVREKEKKKREEEREKVREAERMKAAIWED